MKRARSLFIFIALLSFYACDSNSKSDKQIEDSSDNSEYVNSSTPNCTAPASWFTQVNGTRKTPAPNEGPTSVFANNKTVTNCDFHQWSWQKFLWLTNESNGVPLFMDQLIQVSSSGGKLPTDQGIILVDTAQASDTTDILRTPGDNGKPSTTVYYSIFVDKSMYAAILKYGPVAAQNPSQLKDVVFPVGALEVKASWIDASALEDPSSYFVTNGTIAGKKARVALLGMHVVGVVENHPEFVWATFEHHELAPMYDWEQATPTSDAPVQSKVDYPFFSKNAISTVKNITSQNGDYTNVFSVYKYGVPVQKEIKGSFDVQVFMETSQNGSENFNHIRTINESVQKQLSGIWNNYFYNGSIWINTEGYEGTAAQAALLDSKGFNLSSSEPGDLTRGSVAAYNITMETYVQVGFGHPTIYGQTAKNLVNCFLLS